MSHADHTSGGHRHAEINWDTQIAHLEQEGDLYLALIRAQRKASVPCTAGGRLLLTDYQPVRRGGDLSHVSGPTR